MSAGDGVSNPGTIYKFTPAGVRTTFASGLFYPFALAFDSRGNLFVADGGFAFDLIFGAAVYKFTPSGLRSTVASENDQVRVIPAGLAIDSADNLFVAGWAGGSILKFTPSGVRTIFASRFVPAMAFQPRAMAFQPNAAPRAAVIDFNGDGHPDYVLQNAATRQTAIWYLNNNVFIRPALSAQRLQPAGDWRVWRISIATAIRIMHLFNPCYPIKRRCGICQDQRSLASAYGSTLPTGWELVAAADFNGDNKPDYVLYNVAPAKQRSGI